MPSKHEANLQRRQSPGLTRVNAASVSFAPLQGFFGIVTPNGLHFERHHQGWHDIDPTRHRLMVNGLVDLMPDGLHRQYTSIQECKSVITTPSGGQVLLDRGFHSITGLAWSGRGRISRVDVSTDGGRSWRAAQPRAAAAGCGATMAKNGRPGATSKARPLMSFFCVRSLSDPWFDR